jgi:hypothetical protein
MPNPRLTHLRFATRNALRLWAGCLLLAGVAHGQIENPQLEQPQPGTLADAINEVNQGNFAYVREVVTIVGAEKAIPILEDLFAHAKDVETKPWIAAELVKLGDKDNSYWNFVAEQAREELENGPPDFLNFDQEGKSTAGPSPEFIAWAKAHHVTVESVAFEAVYPVKFGLLVTTEDPRAIPLLRRGLLAANHQVEAIAAAGLASLKDKDSIPLIVEACRRAPSDARFAIAMSLLQFHDPQAQSAAEPYLPADLVTKLREEIHHP